MLNVPRMSFIAKNPVCGAFSCHVPLTSFTLEHFFSLSLILMTLTLLRASLVAQLVKNSPAMQETWIQSLGRSPGEGESYPFQYSGLENFMDCIGKDGGVYKYKWLFMV